MKYPSYVHEEVEKSILAFWKRENVVEKLRERNKGGEKFYFLDGPPYTSGRIHLGHAWNKALKDMVLRYKRMHGFNVWDRAGFDMHGLPTEHKVMAKFDLKTKEDIEKFGYTRFREECYSFCMEMMNLMVDDFTRIGTTLDYSDPDQPIKAQRISAVWKFIKKAHEDDRLYLGKRTLHWDPKDQSALAKHELEYKQVTDTSIYVKFKIVGREKESLVIWTTTPWTIPFDLFVMVHPEFEYVKVDVEGEVWIFAKSRLEAIKELTGKEMQVIETLVGKDLEGLRYEHFWNEEIAELHELYTTNDKVHSVLLSSEYVNDSDGTGIVHGAPGCGPEDYEVGHLHKIPPFNTLDESGIFPAGMGFCSGFVARYDDAKFVEAIEEKGNLVAQKKYRHDYPHGERSKEPIIFRTTPQWFLKVEDLRDEMLAHNEKVDWVPESGKNAFRNWLEHVRDNSITKQRFWGTPAPIWKSKDGDIYIVESLEELEKLAINTVPADLHKPEIDEVVIQVEGKEYRRIPDVLDVWIDPGCQSWIMLGEDNFEKFFPTDFIVEGKDQIRAWFNLLWICSHIYKRKPSFENVFMHGFINDVDGVKMSKSLGNIISPNELTDKHGADTLRNYMIQTTAGEDVNFSWDEAALKSRQLMILWNLQKLVLNLAGDLGVNPFTVTSMEIELAHEERYLNSRVMSTVREVTGLLDSYRLNEVVRPLEDLFLDMSRVYVQMVREKSSTGSLAQRKGVVVTLAQALLTQLKMFQVVAPFICEAIYQNLREAFGFSEVSISHCAWPTLKENNIDTGLEESMKVCQQIIAGGLAAREKAKLGVRWPVANIVIVSSQKGLSGALNEWREAILTKLNTKGVELRDSLQGVRVSLKANPSRVGPDFAERSREVMAWIEKADPLRVATQLETQGFVVVEIDGNDVRLERSHIFVNREIPEPYFEGEARCGLVYLDSSRSEELVAEGFSRELVRKIQNMRKQQSFEKKDMAKVSVSGSKRLIAMLAEYRDSIASRVGAAELVLADNLEHGEHFSIKGEKIFVLLEKV